MLYFVHKYTFEIGNLYAYIYLLYFLLFTNSVYPFKRMKVKKGL